jgi:hypothetical protein
MNSSCVDRNLSLRAFATYDLCHKLGHKSLTSVAICGLLRPRQTCYLIESYWGAIKKCVLRIGCSTN